MYAFCALIIQSELELPGLAPGHGSPDVLIRFAPVPPELDQAAVTAPMFQASRQRFLLRLPRVARYMVTDGREILIDRQGGTDQEVRTFLLGSALGALLHQRGLLPLHASAIRTEAGAVAFAGASGAGKSTLAAAFARRGYPVLADDIVPVLLDGTGRPVVAPHSANIKLRFDSLDQLGIGHEGLPRVRPTAPKYVWPSIRDETEPVPLFAVYRLDQSNEPGIVLEPATGVDRFNLLRRQTYRPRMMAALGDQAIQFRVIAAVSQHARVARVRRPATPFLIDELVDLLSADFHGLSSRSPSRLRGARS